MAAEQCVFTENFISGLIALKFLRIDLCVIHEFSWLISEIHMRRILRKLKRQNKVKQILSFCASMIYFYTFICLEYLLNFNRNM